jgi:hypothetical protein
MGAATDKVYLCFYATGVSAAGLANVCNGERRQRAGDVCRQRRLQRHRSGERDAPGVVGWSGTVTLQLTASGIASNAVQLAIE